MAAVTFSGKGPLMVSPDGTRVSEAGAAGADGEPGQPGAGAEGKHGPRASRGKSMRWSIFWSFFALSALLLAAVYLGAGLFMQRTIVSGATHDLMQECQTLADVLDRSADPVETARRMGYAGTRLTVVNADGTVAYDNVEDASSLASHADRPEIRQALEEGEGSSVRGSQTLAEIMIYGAVRLDSGQVLRVSVTRSSVLGVLADLAPVAACAACLSFAACAVLSRWLARRLVAPLDALDPADPQAHRAGAYEEVRPLLDRMEEQNRQIAEQVRHLSDNDRMRVEFTANVTHELKTPLTSISGYAELIETGLAAPKDVPEFGRRIHEESVHLAALVNDILTLSKMDEAERADGVLGTCEPVDLAQVALSVADRLSSRASEAQVDVRVERPEGAVLALGMPKLVDQIVFNLCDNAIRYNRAGGSVTVSVGVGVKDARPFVRVRDTGIGIAPENLEKVFARFYRVDASRSRETGGTGLGLAIVKHAARCHDARLDISSEPGVGTCISVTFHAADDSAWTKRA